jgi:molecular chaperone GrpE
MSKKEPANSAEQGAPKTGGATPVDTSEAAAPPPAAKEPVAAAEFGPGASSSAAAEPAADYRDLYEQANDRCLRARADLENYRKRVQREFGEIRYQTILQTASEFLGVYDHLSLALAHAQTAADASSLRQGLELINAEFERILTGLGVSRVETAGAPFDPACHEALAQEASEDVPAGIVLREWKAGFVLGGRLLRPAVVTVSSGPASAAVASPVGEDAGKGKGSESAPGQQ